MTIEEQIKYWFDIAEDDLIVTESNFNNCHYLWCLFICHIILEKGIKALYVQSNHESPPKIHDLVKLSKLASVVISEEDLRFLDEMNKFNIEARYPDYKEVLKKFCTKEYTEIRYNKTKEIFQWLKSQKK
jgi:HEPN domain-containing protein